MVKSSLDLDIKSSFYFCKLDQSQHLNDIFYYLMHELNVESCLTKSSRQCKCSCLLSRISELIPDATMNDTTTTETSQSLWLSDLENDTNNEWITLEGPRDLQLGLETGWDDFDLLEAKITQFDSAPYRTGNTRWSSGWRHTRMG